MKKESILLIASTLGAVLIALGIIRWLAPGLLGLPVDMKLVKTSEEVPPFFSNVFRKADYESLDFLINDPVVVVRGRPGFPEGGGLGPHDILGFRNRYVPNKASIVVIGDSQTYGNNVQLNDNWPNVMRLELGPSVVGVYAMAVGGWGAAQYIEMAVNATIFRPKVVVVAFYTGNDSLESFKVVYGDDRWADFRPNKSLTASDAPRVSIPIKTDDTWSVSFGSGQYNTTFTPVYRLASNQDIPAVHAGYTVMANAAKEIARLLSPHNIITVFTIIPTKEFVYAERIKSEGIDVDHDYATLIKNETMHLSRLADALKHIDGGIYVDVAGPMRRGALEYADLYPRDTNGHPLERGYKIIGVEIAQAIRKIFPNQF